MKPRSPDLVLHPNRIERVIQNTLGNANVMPISQRNGRSGDKLYAAPISLKKLIQ